MQMTAPNTTQILDPIGTNTNVDSNFWYNPRVLRYSDLRHIERTWRERREEAPNEVAGAMSHDRDGDEESRRNVQQICNSTKHFYDYQQGHFDELVRRETNAASFYLLHQNHLDKMPSGLLETQLGFWREFRQFHNSHDSYYHEFALSFAFRGTDSDTPRLWAEGLGSRVQAITMLYINVIPVVKERERRLLAVAMSGHARLGAASSLRLIEIETLRQMVGDLSLLPDAPE